jgi:uncharacterized membrane protein
VFPRRTRLALWSLAGAHFALLCGLSFARYLHVHQRTFDLALYARIAWGWAHGDGWAPLVGASSLGCHLSPVLLPLGLLGRVLGTVPVLLVAQALCIALALFPLARIGARRLGTRGVWLAAAAYLLYPNLFHVGTYEFHPGTLAVLPMLWAFDALDRGDLRTLGYATLGLLACREELGLFAAIVLVLHHRSWSDKRALYAAGACVAYVVAGLAIVSSHAPAQGSADAHFGVWGGSPFGVFSTLVNDPAKVLAHFRARLGYVPRVLAPLSFFSLRAPRLLLPALPYLALNMLSAFPTADEQYSHYLTPALPALLVSGLVGVSEVRAKFPRMTWFAALAIAHFAFGGSPLSRDFDRSAFLADDATLAGRRVLARIPEGASVQAPDALLPHLAERVQVHRAPPPNHGQRFSVLDVSHRQRYARHEVLLRTSEEPVIRSWLAQPDQTLLVYAPPYALFEAKTGYEASDAPGARHCFVHRGSGVPQPLTSCLDALAARLEGSLLVLTLRARHACPADLALRFGPDTRPARVELPCDGAFSPARLREGDVVESRHQLRATELALIRERGLWVGALMSSGDPVRGSDPAAIALPLVR